MKKVTLTIPEDQYQYLKKHDLKPSWILQKTITERMEYEIKSAADILKEEGYLPFEQYKKIIDEFDKKIGDSHEKLTERELKRDLRRLTDINRKISDEIKWVKEQLGKQSTH